MIHINVLAGVDDEWLKIKVNDDKAQSLSRVFETVMPGGNVIINVIAHDQSKINITSDHGRLVYKGERKWKYFAPEKPGNYNVVINDITTDKSITLIIFVLTPSADQEGEYLNNYRIGNYPDDNYKGNKNYTKPEGFIEVTESNKNLFITPHFQLKQFLCKQKSEWPKYLLLNPRLLIKLEFLVEALNESGHDVVTLFIMSGYRTPYYNKAIGNVKYSRHIYGDAADVYVDENLDGVIDDLDENGKSEMKDAHVLHSLLSNLEKDPENEHLIGGIGSYKKNSAHTYFIHVDTRGYRARW